jgi:hypothetical protein
MLSGRPSAAPSRIHRALPDPSPMVAVNGRSKTPRREASADEVSNRDNHRVRTHLSLEKDSPEPRRVERPDQGGIVAMPMVGGLHHRYTRLAA